MINKLFVYGSLVPGQANEHILKNIDSNGKWVKATVKGQLYENGWGDYPGIIPDNNGKAIDGLLFISDKLDQCWEQLDTFEGEGYERVVIDAIDIEANVVDAYIYKLKDPTSVAQPNTNKNTDDGSD